MQQVSICIDSHRFRKQMCVLILAFSYFYVWTSVKVGYSYLLCSVLISGSIWPVKFRLFCVQHFSSLLQLQQLSIRSPIKFGNLWSILSSKVRSIRSISMQQFVWVDLTQTPFFPVLSVLLLFAFFCRFLSVLIFLCLYLWVYFMQWFDFDSTNNNYLSSC